MSKVRLVEQHIIKASDPRFDTIDKAAFAAKNLYNAANYIVRQSFIFKGEYINFAAMYHLVKHSDEYKALPRKVSNLVLKQLDQNWRSFFAAIKAWRTTPSKFLGRPKLPKYKDKTKGRFVLMYDIQAISKKSLRDGIVKPSQLGIEVKTNKENIKQCRIAPRKGYYIIEIVYEVNPVPAELDYSHIASIDAGIDNLATITSNKLGFQPVIVNGRPLKSINQFYNKRRAELQSRLRGNRLISNRIDRLTYKRNNKVKDYLHKASRYIVDLLVSEGIGVLVIGRNKGWKNEANIGSRNNQNFVQIPHAKLWQMVEYKARLVGIFVHYQEESYTSKCSFLDLEPIRKYSKYLGRRIQRGLFKSANGTIINADVNGSYNILRKAFPEAVADGIEGFAVSPVRVSPASR